MKFGTTASVAALAMAISLVDGGVALAVEGGQGSASTASIELGSIATNSVYSGADDLLLYETIEFDEVSSGSSVLITEPSGCETIPGSTYFNCDAGVIEMTPFTLHGAFGNETDLPYSVASEQDGIRLTIDSDAENVTVMAVAGVRAQQIVSGAQKTTEGALDGLALGGVKEQDVENPYGDLFLTATFPGPVKIPSWYKYCPTSCKPKVLHDYCSYSPDWHMAADFRGPCALHDLGIDSLRKASISVTAKRYQRGLIDDRFQKNLHTNCNYYNSKSYTARASCRGVANVYYEVVKAKTKNWDGN